MDRTDSSFFTHHEDNQDGLLATRQCNTPVTLRGDARALTTVVEFSLQHFYHLLNFFSKLGVTQASWQQRSSSIYAYTDSRPKG